MKKQKPKKPINVPRTYYEAPCSAKGELYCLRHALEDNAVDLMRTARRLEACAADLKKLNDAMIEKESK